MTRLEKAEQLFRRLDAENLGLLLAHSRTALAAENSVKRALGLTGRTGQKKAVEETGAKPPEGGGNGTGE
ncbi:MAG: hypothetical protein LBC62_10515 [Treponema sp.]|nr:hypothetical protein [Treponema sp.]